MDMPDWVDEEVRKAKNMKPASLSNLSRLLLLSKVSRRQIREVGYASASYVNLASTVRRRLDRFGHHLCSRFDRVSASSRTFYCVC